MNQGGIDFRYRDERGRWTELSGELHRPTGDGPFPLIYHAGYSVPDALATAWTSLGAVVVSPPFLEDDALWPHGNPLGRGIKLDEALLRTARSLPFVDDRRVVITGGSAGGYMTMMLTAATFPLAGSFPICPPLNLPYQIATWEHRLEEISALRDDGETTVMLHPGSPEICGMWRGVLTLHGRGARLWHWSPLAHLDQVTCPVVLWISTADALVPVPQYGGPLDEVSAAGAPRYYPTSPDIVCTEDVQRRRLLDVLRPDEVEVHVIPVDPDIPLLLDVDNPPPGGVVLPTVDRNKRWLVMFLDEGSPGPDVGHFKHAVGIDTVRLMGECLDAGVDVGQLTTGKANVLADRWLGRDWIEFRTTRRDHTDEELRADRHDVRRALATYRSISAEHDQHMHRVIGQLDRIRRDALQAALAATEARELTGSMHTTLGGT